MSDERPERPRAPSRAARDQIGVRPSQRAPAPVQPAGDAFSPGDQSPGWLMRSLKADPEWPEIERRAEEVRRAEVRKPPDATRWAEHSMKMREQMGRFYGLEPPWPTIKEMIDMKEAR